VLHQLREGGVEELFPAGEVFDVAMALIGGLEGLSGTERLSQQA
jgi:hypothetical protein